MPALSEVARFNRTFLPEELQHNQAVRELDRPGDNYPLAAEMVWAVLHAQAVREGKPTWVGDNGVLGRTLTDMGTMQAVEILWPDITSRKEHRRANNAIRKHLVNSNNVQVLQQAKGPLQQNGRVKFNRIRSEWWIAEEFQPLKITRPEMSRASFRPKKAELDWGNLYVPFDDPREDYDEAAYAVWLALFNYAKKHGVVKEGSYYVPDRIGAVTACRAIWPNISLKDLDAVKQSIALRLKNAGLYRSSHQGLWVGIPNDADNVREQIKGSMSARRPNKLEQELSVKSTETLEPMGEVEKEKDNEAEKYFLEKQEERKQELHHDAPTWHEAVNTAINTMIDSVDSAIMDLHKENARLREENEALIERLESIKKVFE